MLILPVRVFIAGRTAPDTFKLDVANTTTEPRPCVYGRNAFFVIAYTLSPQHSASIQLWTFLTSCCIPILAYKATDITQCSHAVVMSPFCW